MVTLGRRAALLCAAALATAALSGSGTASGPGPTALFFGDSLFVGTGSTAGPVEARTAARLLGWQPIVDAVGGTGYTTGGRRGHPYLTRLARDGYLSHPYDVIVLEGGTNDAHHGDLTQLRARALATVDYVHRRQPAARIVLVGAFVAHGVPHPERYDEVDRVLSEVAADRDLTYVSQRHYAEVTATSFLARDHFHPSAGGYTVMGRDLARALR